MNQTKKQLQERIRFLEENLESLEHVLALHQKRLDERHELKDEVLRDLFLEFPIMFQTVINTRHPGSCIEAKVAKIKEYRELLGWGLYESKVFVETGKIPNKQ